jgi:hypothetical protein
MKLPAGFLRFTLRMLLISTCCSVVIGIFLQMGVLRLSSLFAFSPLALFFLLGLTLHYYFLKSLNGRPQQFINTFMAGQALKMLIHLLVLVLVSFAFPESAIHFILLYAVCYLVFTVAEVVELGSVSKLQKESGF